jgi:hypothetical protein
MQGLRDLVTDPLGSGAGDDQGQARHAGSLSGERRAPTGTRAKLLRTPPGPRPDPAGKRPGPAHAPSRHRPCQPGGPSVGFRKSEVNFHDAK